MGNLKDISTARMVRITEAWLDPARQRPLFEALPAGTSLLDRIQTAHTGLLATQVRDSQTAKDLSALSDQQSIADRRHDRSIRAAWFILTGFAEAASSPDDAQALLAARDELLPNGLSAILNSYQDEAGAVELADARISKTTRALLKKLPVPGGKLSGVVDGWFEAGRTLGKLEDQKEKLLATNKENTPSKSDALVARNFWIKVVRHVETTLELDAPADATTEAILGPVRMAERESAQKNTRPAEPIQNAEA